MQTTTDIYAQTIEATLKEDRKALRSLVRQSNDLFYAAREKKYAMLPTLHKFHEENYIDTGHYYVQVVDYISEMCKALVHITRPCYEHIDNNHRGMSEEQIEDLTSINNSVSELYSRINDMLQSNDFANIDIVLAMRDDLFDLIAQAIKNQLRRIQNNSTSTKASMLYLTILNETKTMVLQSRNLLKSQKYFVEAQRTESNA
jgi:Na+/phosphate symporter